MRLQKRWIIIVVSLLALTLACQGLLPQAAPTLETAPPPAEAATPTVFAPPPTLPSPITLTPTDSPASPTPSPQPLARVPPEQVFTALVVTGADGAAAFNDPLSGHTLTLAVQDGVTQAALPGMQVWFVSNGPEALVVAVDPNGVYAPLAEMLGYEELSALGRPGHGKLASPPVSGSLAYVLTAVKYEDVKQTEQAWGAYFSNMPPTDIWAETWSEVCAASGEQASISAELTGAVFALSAPDPPSVMSDMATDGAQIFLAANAQGAPVWAAGRAPSVVRWRVAAIRGGAPQLVTPIGYCLEPLDQTAEQSVLDWVRYGIAQESVFPFAALAAEDVGYAVYIEGGQGNTAEEFLAHLDARLSSGPQCEAVSRDGDTLQVWTSGWKPPWEMVESCYVECATLDPPYQSNEAAFFLYEVDGLWSLRAVWLNDASLWTDVYGVQLVSCDTPFAEIPLGPAPTPVPATCPGSPPQRMVVDARGFVCTQADQLIVRSGPSRAASEVIRLAPGTYFTVTGGPACADDWSWWKIRTDDGVVGWVAEGGDAVDPYFVCPVR